MAFNEEKHILLSYHHKNEKIVLQIKEQLENNGILVWFDERNTFDRYVFHLSNIETLI